MSEKCFSMFLRKIRVSGPGYKINHFGYRSLRPSNYEIEHIRNRNDGKRSLYILVTWCKYAFLSTYLKDKIMEHRECSSWQKMQKAKNIWRFCLFQLSGKTYFHETIHCSGQINSEKLWVLLPVFRIRNYWLRIGIESRSSDRKSRFRIRILETILITYQDPTFNYRYKKNHQNLSNFYIFRVYFGYITWVI